MQIRNLNHLVALLMTMFFSLIIFYPILLASDNKKMDDYFCKDIKKPFFKVSSKNESGEIIIPGRSQGRDFEFLMPKPLGKKRIFIVGGSVAGLMYWPDNSFVNEFVANPEIINCGMGAYDSGRILDVFAEVMDYQPDIVIVLSGNNEVGLETCHGITPEMKRRFQVIKINSKRLFSDYKMKEAEHFVSIKVHEERLRKMAKIAKKKNIPVVFCTLPANMSDFPPFGSLPFEIKDFAKAFFLMETGDFKGAEKIFKTILTERPREPFVHFYLAKALERLKKINEAKRHYQLAIEWDNRADRISQERNEMIRKVAKEEGACLVDLEKSFMKVSKNEIIDGAYIVDGVHWFGKYNDFVISQTLKYIGACENSGGIFKKQKVSKSKNMPEVDLDKVHEDSKEDALEIFHYAIAFIVNEQANGKINERALMMLARVYKRAGNIIDEASQSENALKKYTKQNFWTKQIMDPVSVALWRPGFHHHLAEFFRRRGELNQAKKNIDEAL
ncbi:MAG: hypothetical protein KKD35_00925, partial [Elusimicrobia bacterium]|nr:hypothetical protein [Elusimicrobiota bacterium]